MFGTRSGVPVDPAGGSTARRPLSLVAQALLGLGHAHLVCAARGQLDDDRPHAHEDNQAADHPGPPPAPAPAPSTFLLFPLLHPTQYLERAATPLGHMDPRPPEDSPARPHQAVDPVSLAPG